MSSETPEINGLSLDGSLAFFLTGLLRESGADRIVLLLARENVLFREADFRAGEVCQLPLRDVPLSQCNNLPHHIIERVLKSSRFLTSNDDVSDPYFDEVSCAWMCAPLGYSGRCSGVVYFEDCKPGAVLDGKLLIRLQRKYMGGTEALNRELERQVAEGRRDRERLEELVRARTMELEAAQKELVRKERLATLGQLIATVSHELRNPLGTVRGSVFLIANKLLGKDLGVERALDRAERNIVRCDRIIEDLLAYTRTHDLELEFIRIDRWLEHTMEEYSFPHDVTIRAQFRTGVRLTVEPERLRRCLINLINNACDAMKAGKSEEEDGSKVLTVSSRLNRVRGRVEISVADSGPGIPPEERDKILEPLFSTKSFGVGLGLPTVIQIMEQHQGGLEIESEVGKGTEMILWIPYANEGEK